MDKAYIGSDLKFLVEPSAAGFDKLRDDWEVTVSRGSKTQTWTKAELVVDEENNYYVCFSTVDFGPGQYYITVATHTPDEDFEDGMRDEKVQYPLCVVERLKK